MNAKVAIVSHTAELTGVPECTATLLEGLDRGRFTPVVFCPYRGPFVERLEALDVDVTLALDSASRDSMRSAGRVVRAFRFGPKYLRQLTRWLAVEQPDLVYLPSVGLVTPAVLSWIRGAPLVAHVNESWSYFRGLANGLRRYPLLRSARHFIAASESTRRMLGEVGVSVDRVSVVHNGVDVRRFDVEAEAGSKLRREWGIDEHAVVVGTVGAIQPRKGTVEFVRVAKSLRDRGLDLHFVVVGDAVDTAYRERVVAEIAAEGLQDRVHLAGFRSDIPACFAAFDVFAIPTREEAFALVNLEAMAAGRPVVSTRVHGTAEAVVHGEQGLLVGPGDLEGFADAIAALAQDAELRGSMGAAGRCRVEERFGSDRFVAGVVAVWEGVLGGDSRSAGASSARELRGVDR